MGMEKEKPHKCEFCHKRYKNLNGLKYVSQSCLVFAIFCYWVSSQKILTRLYSTSITRLPANLRLRLPI